MILLFFPDFKRIVKSEQFNGSNEHPVLYFESENDITFYKPTGSFIYYTIISKEGLPEDFNIENTKSEFNATELPIPLNKKENIILTGTFS